MEHQFPRGRRPWWKAAWFVIVSTILMVLGGCGIRNEAGGGGAGGAAGHAGESVVEPTEPDESVQADEARLDRIGKYESFVGGPASATACTLGSQCPTGNCVDGFCCDSKCDNKCMACSAAKKGSGVDGICGSIAYDTDPDNDCPYGACDGKNQCKNYNGYTCGSAAQCLSNYCVDGYCCGNICMGACQACSAAKKGSGSNGVCGNIAVNTDPDNECNPGECTGSGACNASPQPLAANGAACSSSAQCSSGFCADGVCCDSWCLGTCQACTAAKKGSGTDGTCGNVANDKDPDDECWGGACNGSGVCKQYNGVPCVDKSQCLSGYCVDGFCCGNICTGMCYACSEARKGQGYDGVCGPILSGKDPDNECNPGECGGAGTCNQPQTPQANGTVCASAGQCASGNCIDGVCCDTSCTGLCNACTAAKKGQGANGTCGPILAETDPENECGIGGRCGGNSACKYYNGATCSAGTQCFSNYCVDGVCCGNVCTGSCYACSATKKGQGSDGACGPIANTRDPDNECNPGECNGSGACNQSQVLLANGAACTLATQCSSGFCTDGVCCDKACGSLCEACTATKKGSGTDGTCGSIKYDADPDNECASGSCSGTGTCQFYNGVACTGTGDCLSHYCVDGYCCGNVCNLSCMACSAAKKGSGSNGSCGPIAANTDPDAECGSGKCSGTTGCSMASLGAACTANNQCASGFCADGICCNAACTGLCQACTAVKKGSGSDGTCGNIADGKDPDNECTAGTCTGFGTCLSGTLGRPCAGANDCNGGICTEGVCCDSQCTGTCKSCLAAKKGSGTDGTCGTIGIGLDPDNECIDGACGAGGSCKSDNGIPCANAAACVSGYCIDGVCCNTSCHETCKSCNVPGSVGVCSPHGANACNACGGVVAISTLPGTGPYYGTSEVGDFDNDGVDDVAHYSGGVVTVMVGIGNGMFTKQSETAIGSSSGRIFAGDLNADGALDLVATKGDVLAFTVLMNQGNGSFAPGVDYSASLGYSGSVVIADLNGDGHLDIATSNYGMSGNWPHSVSAFLGNGDGTFAPKIDSVFSGVDPEAIAAADMTGDGIVDLAITTGSISLKYVHILRGVGNGTFVFHDDFPFSNPNGDAYGTRLAIAEFNGDGLLDVAIANDAWTIGEIDVFFNLGGGIFGNPYATTVPMIPQSIKAGDMNGDGKLDIVVAGSDRGDGFSVLTNGGAGSFTPAYFRTSVSATYGSLIDVENDGDLDVVLATQDGFVSLLNPGNAGFEYDGGLDSERTIKPIDLNGDGKLDLVRTGGGIGVQLNQGNNTFGGEVAISTSTSVEIVDVNSDNKPDLIIPNPSSATVSVRLNNGNGTFANATNYATGSSPVHVAAADLTGDGKPDLAVVNNASNSLSILRNNGNGTFAAKVDFPTATTPIKVVAADMNGDNLLDLVVGADGNRNIDVAYNQGNGTFALADFATSGYDGADYLAKDFTGDGKADFAIFDGSIPNFFIAVRVNQGSGTFSAPVNRSIGHMSISANIALELRDMEGDGKLDLWVYWTTMANFGLMSGSMSVLPNFGNGVFGSQNDYPTYNRAVADFNNDGLMDVIRAEASNAMVKYGVCLP